MPDTGDGISVSTLSVETSSNASSAATASPTFFSHLVTVPSVTDSPKAGIETIVAPLLAAAGAGVETCTGATGVGVGAGVATGAGAATGAGVCAAGFAAEPDSAITASSAPTATVESTCTTIFCNTPATGDGISVSTLSVETSSNGSSTAIESPSFLSQRVTVPSVTDSPSAGMVTENVIYFSTFLLTMFKLSVGMQWLTGQG